MARFVVERSFPDGLEIPLTEQGAQACMSVVGTNAEFGVTWVHSYVTEDHKKTFCIYDAPNPEAIRQAAKLNQLPADAITPVRVLADFIETLGSHNRYAALAGLQHCVVPTPTHRRV